MRLNHRTNYQLLATASLAALIALPAHAQVDDTGLTQAELAGADRVDEIIVTARKRETSLQDTPLAISAFDQEALQEAAFEDIIDVSKATPGLFIEKISDRPARFDASPRIRGITVDNSNPLLRTSSVFVDGIYVVGGIQGLGVQELERVEVIKGPQSALFGRNTFSGAINYVTKDPSAEFGGHASVLAATRDEYRGTLTVEGPIAGETLTGRLTGSYDFNGGHYDNAAVEGQELGEESTWAVSGTLAFQPNDRFDAKLRGTYYQDDDGPAAVVQGVGFSDFNFGAFPLPGGGTTEGVFRGTIPTPVEGEFGVNTSQELYDELLAIAQADARDIQELGITYEDLGGFGLKREAYRLGLELGYEFNENLRADFLGGYNDEVFLFYGDFDGTPDFAFNTSQGRDLQDLSLEGRLSGSVFNDFVDWTVGANYLDIDITTVGGFYDGVLGFYFPGLFNDRFETGAETRAVFGSLDFNITDQFTLILEGRYQEDEITEDAVNAGLADPISPATFENFLPRVLLQFEPSDATTLYLNYSEGNLPGGFNQEVGELDAAQLAELREVNPGADVTFGEETLTNYEFGWKQQILDGVMAFNLAAFYMERTDQIYSGFSIVADPANVNGVRSVAFTNNGATTDILGLEFDGRWDFSDYTDVFLTLAVIDADIASFPEDATAGDFTDIFGPDADFVGVQAPRFPPLTGSLSVSHERPVELSAFGSTDTSWFIRGDAFYTGPFFDSFSATTELEDAVDVNLRTGLDFGSLRAELFVTNLFDEDTPVAANNLADTSFAVRFGSGLFDFTREGTQVALRDKRQFGIRLDYEF